jgi:hypothetical protein
MGWWSLGPEDDDSSAGSSVDIPMLGRAGRNGRGGRGRGVTGGRVSIGRLAAAGRAPPSGARKNPTTGKIEHVVDNKPVESPSSLFTSIGRMVTTLAGVDDDTTVASRQSAKYQTQPKGAKASKNADDAQRRANEMANAMAWLTSGGAAPEEPETADAPAPGAGLFTGGDNWWEKDETSSVSDDVSLFSANTDFKTQDVPDLMTMLK